MATYINLIGRDIRIVDEDTEQHIEFPPSLEHEPVSAYLQFGKNSDRPGAAHRVVVDDDGLIVDAKLRVTGLKFSPEPDVTYIIDRATAFALHGHGKLPFDAVYPDGWSDEGDDGIPEYTTFVRLDAHQAR